MGWRLSLLKKSSVCLHLSGAVIVKTRARSAFILNSFNIINALRKNIVKSVAIFYCAALVGILHGFLFVFPESNLYNAARLAGRVSFKVIFKMIKIEALILKPARDGHKGEIDREQEKTCQPRYSDY